MANVKADLQFTCDNRQLAMKHLLNREQYSSDSIL